MKERFFGLVSILLAAGLTTAPPVFSGERDIPHLQKQGTATQLIVDGEPLIMLGGELGNSSASDMDSMRPVWPKLVRLNLNTVLAPVYWELVEPEEGRFDFSLVDGLIDGARDHGLRLVLLWFGTWKNSMSCYAPMWVKTDTERFPRARLQSGRAVEILSPFGGAGRDADARAFAALMRHIREKDGKHHTIVMIQVENEVGMIPEARDHSPEAEVAFAKPVPRELMDYLQRHRETLIPEFRSVWQKTGFRMSGTWEEVFGKGAGTEEIFMAWHFARYVDTVARAGKAEYPLPMFVNAALIRPGYQPGQYPSAGPLPHLMDVWRAGAPRIDFLAPDIYFPNFAEWCGKYHRSGNPLFIPEASRGVESAVHVFYAIGRHDAMGFSPFSIESMDGPAGKFLTEAYSILSQLTPLILRSQGKGVMTGILLDETEQIRDVTLGQYTLKISHDYTWGWTRRASDSPEWPRVGGLIIATGSDEYVIAGSGIIVTFTPDPPEDKIAGIGAIDEGVFLEGRFVPGRRLNGDENHQGRHLRIPNGEFGIQRITLYQYR